jgi:hypothetical protein
MYKILQPNNALRLLDKTELVKLKKRAVRSGSWFRALSRMDRVLFDLTIKVAEHIRSITLAKRLLIITRKLRMNMERSLSRTLRETGMPLAQKLSLVVQTWGNISAKNWVFAPSFVKFLAIMHINAPKTFKSLPQ